MGSSKPSIGFFSAKRRAHCTFQPAAAEVSYCCPPDRSRTQSLNSGSSGKLGLRMRGAPRGLAFITRKTGEEREKTSSRSRRARSEWICLREGNHAVALGAHEMRRPRRSPSEKRVLAASSILLVLSAVCYDFDAQRWMRPLACLASHTSGIIDAGSDNTCGSSASPSLPPASSFGTQHVAAKPWHPGR